MAGGSFNATSFSFGFRAVRDDPCVSDDAFLSFDDDDLSLDDVDFSVDDVILGFDDEAFSLLLDGLSSASFILTRFFLVEVVLSNELREGILAGAEDCPVSVPPGQEWTFFLTSGRDDLQI